jgi:hypothetical protein
LKQQDLINRLRDDGPTDRSAKPVLAGAGIGLGGELISSLLLMLFIGTSPADDALPYLITVLPSPVGS